MAHTSPPTRSASIPFPAADTDPRLASTAAEDSDTHEQDQAAELTQPIVAYHLFALAFLVYAIVVVGGLTRLTESGLSITEWNPGFKGMRLPSTDEEWHKEWDKYKLTPEFVLLNQRMSLEDFKSIYMWEWAHRVLGRVIGVAFVLPAAFFLARPGWVARGTRWKLVAIGAGIGFQGALGWFMVKSGLSAPKLADASPQAQALAKAEGGNVIPPLPRAAIDSHDLHSTAPADDPNWTPRVSHFRLAAHLGTAFLVYLGMLHTGLVVMRDWKLANNAGTVAGIQLATPAGSTGPAVPPRQRVLAALSDRAVRKYARTVRSLSIFVFCTAMSGALVAGLDAGMIYNEWPTMGGEGRLAPPSDELLDRRYALRGGDSSAGSSWRLWVGNTFNNPATVQLVHRTLAITSFFAVVALAWKTRSLRLALLQRRGSTSSIATARAAQLPPLILRLAALACGAVTMQATLGITTLLYLVPIPLASAHQAGSLALLSVLIALAAALRRPGAGIVRVIEAGATGSGKIAADAWREQVKKQALQRVLRRRTV